jgi:toluene monooxygenase system ferredoxin subunit
MDGKEITMEIVDALKRTDLFTVLSDETLKAVADMTRLQSFEDGETLYELGDDADAVYVVASGRVRFSLGVGNRPDGGGSIMTEGSVIGWAAVLEDAPRRVATAVCLEDSSLYVIPGDDLLALLDGDAPSGQRMMRRLATLITGDFMAVTAG